MIQCSAQAQALRLALAVVGRACGCQRPPRVTRVVYSDMPIVTELIPPPCAPNAAPSTLERRLATEADARSLDSSRVLVQVLSADSGHVLPGAMVGIDAQRASPTADLGEFALGSLAPGQHSVRVRAISFLPLNDSLLVRAGRTDTLVVRLATWCR